VGDAKAGFSTGQLLKHYRKLQLRYCPKDMGMNFQVSREELKAGVTTSTYIFILSLLFVFLFLSLCMKAGQFFTILLGVPLAAWSHTGTYIK